MTVLRIKHQENYVIISKTVLEDPVLSFKAKGLWAYCMSRPNHWEFHVSHLATVSKDGEDSIYSAIKELEMRGYVRKIQKNENGKFGPVDYEISEIQIILPLRDFPDAGFPDAGNPALVSNDIKVRKDSYSPGTLAPPVYTEEEEEFFSNRIKELPNPPAFISPAYKKKVISGFRSNPPPLTQEQEREANLTVNIRAARGIALEASKRPDLWKGEVSVDRDGILCLKCVSSDSKKTMTFHTLTPTCKPSEWWNVVEKWKR